MIIIIRDQWQVGSNLVDKPAATTDHKPSTASQPGTSHPETIPGSTSQVTLAISQPKDTAHASTVGSLETHPVIASHAIIEPSHSIIAAHPVHINTVVKEDDKPQHNLTDSRVQPADDIKAHSDLVSIQAQVKTQKEVLETTEEKIKSQQDHLLDLKRKVEARQQLLTKLREIGEKSKQDSAEFYFQQLNKLTDEMGVKDKQITIHLDKIKDLEKLLLVARAQSTEANKLSIQLRVYFSLIRPKKKRLN